MKSILFLILSSLLIVSCQENVTKSNEDQTNFAVNKIINDFNYNKVEDGEIDTISFVKVDSVVNIKDYPLIHKTSDTNDVKVFGHTNIDLIVVTVKQYIGGYYKESSILIGHVKDKTPFLLAFTSEPFVISKLIGEYQLNDIDALKLAKQQIIDNEKYMKSYQ